MRKKFKGFTMVELIVVIAIIGIISAILIPSLTKSISKARYTTANSNAKEIYKSLNNYFASEYETIKPSTYANQCTGSTPTSLSDTYNNMDSLAKSYMSKDIGGYYGIKFDSTGYPEIVVWSKTDTDVIIGRYPGPSSVSSPITWSNWNT